MEYVFKMYDGEFWWGGTADYGVISPFDANTEISGDFRVECKNQTMPMFLSSKGRCIWSEEPFKVNIKDGVFTLEGNDITMETFGSTLKDAFNGALNAHFPIDGDELPEEFFRIPQYNTWMQFTYNPTQETVLKYAHDIIDNGLKPGIFIIDEGWQKEYGTWEFDQFKFPEPKKMIDELHEMGFIVMLWVVPSVRCDGYEFVKKCDYSFNKDGWANAFLRNEDGNIAISHWWNGYSATFDMTKEYDRNALDKQLQVLTNEYEIDGFKFDGGRLGHYTDNEAVNGPVDKSHTPAERNIAWNDFGRRYPYHEYKDTFKGGGKRTIQRIRDKYHEWGEKGIASLIPNAILEGIIGHPFICPDMIGGGSWLHRGLNLPIDEELFVRMAQCSALFPMMQFSWAPWEALSAENLALIKEAHDLHIKFADEMIALVNQAYRTGEPIIRSLAYNYPDCGYEKVLDQFMLGEEFLVAPVIVKGATSKLVHLPTGEWEGFDGKTYKGGCDIEIPVTIATLPYFRLKK